MFAHEIADFYLLYFYLRYYVNFCECVYDIN